jgi:hypothetical protein
VLEPCATCWSLAGPLWASSLGGIRSLCADCDTDSDVVDVAGSVALLLSASGGASVAVESEFEGFGRCLFRGAIVVI